MMAAMPEDQRIPAPVPISVDPPLHTKLRQPLFATFSPKTVAGHGTENPPARRDIWLMLWWRKGIANFSTTYPMCIRWRYFLVMFGLPVEKEREYRELAKKHLTVIKPDIAETMLKMKCIADVMRETIIDRRDNPRDDIISLLWALEIDGEPMKLDLMLSYCVILFIAGLDTVVNALGFGVRHLAMDTSYNGSCVQTLELIPRCVGRTAAPLRFCCSNACTEKRPQFPWCAAGERRTGNDVSTECERG